jgi:glucosamine 6-phosphate synthetase-like amidotransferase/phosphosugar isomerase protein
MCGIVGYVGGKDAVPIILDGLRRLECRGYDSAGIAVVREPQRIAWDAMLAENGGHRHFVPKESHEQPRAMRDALLEIHSCPELWSPFLTVIPLPLLAHHVALRAGRDVDQPRNLAKSVTVE